jgi:PKD repeat protein/uncharacterized membrane protein
MKRSRLVLVLLPLIITSLIPPAAASPTYTPGVKQGDSWTFGDWDVSCSFFCPPSFLGPFSGILSLQFQVQNVSGVTVGVKQTIRYYNGNSTSFNFTTNTKSGAGGGIPIVIAGGLAKGDPIYNSTGAPTINDTLPRFYAGATRQVNILSSILQFPGGNQTSFLYWDKITGALLEVTQSFFQSGSSVTLHTRVTSTNLWTPTLPDFSLSATPVSPSPIKVGGTATSTVTLTSLQGLAGHVRVSALVLPSITGHPVAALTPANVTLPGPGTTTLSITTSTNTVPGNYTLLLLATNTTISHFTTLSLSVTGPDFSISASPSFLTVQPGTVGTSTISLQSLKSFSGTVTLSLPSLPATSPLVSLSNYNITLTPGATAESTLTIKVPLFVPSGSYDSTVTGTSGLLVHQAQVSVYVPPPAPPDINLTATPSTLTFQPGSLGVSTITVTSLHGFSGTVNLFLNSPLETGLNVKSLSLSSNVTSASAFLTVSASQGINPGDYPVYVNAAAPRVYRLTVINVQVRPPSPDFSIAPNPSFFNPIAPGTSTNSTIILKSFNGYSDTLNLVPNAPGTLCDPSISPSDSIVQLSSGSSVNSTVTVTVPSCAASRGYFLGLTAIGTHFPMFRDTGIFLQVTGNQTLPDFTLTPTPESVISVPRGSSGNYTVTVKSINGFSGPVTVVPNGQFGEVLNPSRVSLASGGSANVTLTVFAPSFYPPVCCFGVGLLATSVSISHTTGPQMGLNITAGTLGPGFSINASPSFLQLVEGHPQNVTLSVGSLNGFSGTVNLSSIFDPQHFTVSLSQASVTINPTTPATVQMRISNSSSSSVGTWNIIVTGRSGRLSQSDQVSLNVTSSTDPDFSITAVPSALSLMAGSAGTFTLTLTSLNGFTGNVFLLGALVGNGTIFLSPGGSVKTTMWVLPPVFLQYGNYIWGATALSGTIVRSFFRIVTVSSRPDFSIQASPTSLSFKAGSLNSSRISLSSLGGFTGTVKLAIKAFPTGLSLSLTNSTVTLSAYQTSTLNVTASGSTPGSYFVVVDATSGNVTRSLALLVNITGTEVGDFTIQAIPSILSIPQGYTAVTKIILTSLNGFTGSVDLSYSYPFSAGGIQSSATLAPSQSTSFNITIQIPHSAPVGTYTYNITAKVGPLIHRLVIQVNVTSAASLPGYSVTVIPGSLDIAQGASGQFLITVTSFNGFQGSVLLVSSGTWGSTKPGTVQPPPNGTANSTLTISVPASTPVGTYKIAVVGFGGKLFDVAYIDVNVMVPTAPDFRLKAVPSPLTLLIDTSGTSTVTVNAVGGFTGTVTLTNSTSTGLSCSLSKTTITLTSTVPSNTSILSCNSTTSGTYYVTVTGTSNGLQHSVTVAVLVSHSAYLPAVSVGDIASYKLSVQWNSTSPQIPEPAFFMLFASTDHVTFQVTQVSGRDITFSVAWYYLNGTVAHGTVTTNVQTGVSNSTGSLPIAVNNVFLAGGLQAPDSIYQILNSSSLNSTVSKTVLGAARTVNFLNMTSSNPYTSQSTRTGWDQASGVLVGISFNATFTVPGVGTAKGSISVTLSSTNIWTATTSPIVMVNSPTPNPVMTGQKVTITFSVSSGSSVTSISVDWGDGTPKEALPGTATTSTHTYASTNGQKSTTFTINVTATNSLGSGSGTTTETVNDRPPSVSITYVLPTTPTSGQTVTVAFQGTDPDGTVVSFQVNWGDGTSETGIAGTATSASHIYNSAGTFHITVTATDNSGSTGSNTQTITVAAAPTVSFTLTPTSPDPSTTETFTATTSGGVGPFSFSWTFGDTGTSTTNPATHTYATSGSFVVTVTATDANGVRATSSQTITVAATPTVSFTFSPAYPEAASPVTFTATTTGGVSPFGFSWTFGDTGTATTNPATHTYATSGSFTVTVTATDADGVIATSTRTISVAAALGVSFSSTLTSPEINLLETFTATTTGGVGAVTFNWTFGDAGTATINPATHTYAASGSFTVSVTATDANGVKTTSSQTITVVAAPTVALAVSPASPEATAVTTFTATTTGGVSPFGFSWTFGDTGTATTNPATHTYATSGSFTVTVTATDADGVKATSSQTITVAAPLGVTFALGPTSPEANLAETFTASTTGGVGTISFSWTFGDTGTATTNPATHSYTTPGSLTVTVTATDADGIKAASSQTIAVAAAPTVSVTSSPTSPPVNTVVTFTATTTGGVSPFTFSWTFGDTSTATTNPATHTYPALGTFPLTVTVTDANGVAAMSSMPVTVVAKTTASLAVSCSPNTIRVGTFTTCTITVAGSSPSGDVTLSTSSVTGTFTPSTGKCTLQAGTCSVTYTDAATSNTTAVISASYLGDPYNTGGSGSFSLNVVKPSSTLATGTSSLTVTSGKATADQTSTTGISVSITGSTATDGTPVAVATQDLSTPSTGVGSVSLGGAKYYDVVVRGISTGSANVCINYASASSSTTMQYWTGTGWANATGVTINGTTVCGQIPVSALTGTNVAVGNPTQPVSPSPNSSNLLLIIVAVVIAVVVIVAVAAVVLRKRRTPRSQTLR